VTATVAREEEGALRARLAQWFMLGETLAFSARAGCAAGTFRLVDTHLKSGLTVETGVPGLLRALSKHGVAALDDPGQAPDEAMVALANADRAAGMTIRRTALEARECMTGATESAFRYALDNPASVLAYDSANGALMLLDPDTGIMVVTMGAR